MRRNRFLIASIISFALALLCASGLSGANYYVNTNAAAGGDGTTSALTGAHCAWDTIADVNAASFSAGDSVLFARGCTWREQLTVPSSGSAGSPITFGAYGTGDNPIINGADVITGTWVSAPLGIFADDYESGAFAVTGWTGHTNSTVNTWATFGIAGPTYGRTYGVNHSAANASDVNGVTAANSYYTQFDVRPGTDDTKRNYIATVLRSGGSICQLMFNANAGAGTAPLRVYDNVTSAQIGLSTTQRTLGQWYTIKMLVTIGATTGVCKVWVNGVLDIDVSGANLGTNQINGFQQGSSAAGGNDQAKYYDNYVIGTDDLTAGPRWVIPCTVALHATSYTRLFEDDVDIHETVSAPMQANALSIDGAHEWFLDDTNNLLYYRATDNLAPSTHTLEIASRTNCIVCNRDYIDIGNLSLKRSKFDALSIINDNATAIGHINISGVSIDQPGYGGMAVKYNVASVSFAGGEISNSIHCGIYTNFATGASVPDDIDISTSYFHDNYRQNIAIEELTAGSISCNLFDPPESDGTYGRSLHIVNVEGALTVYNNTFYGSAVSCLYIENFTGTVTAKNNIFDSTVSGICLVVTAGAAASDLHLDYNCYYRPTGVMITYDGTNYGLADFATYQAAKSQDADSIATEPLLTSATDFHLLSTSPCINAGVNVGLTTDYAGNRVPQGAGVDIGAYEYPYQNIRSIVPLLLLGIIR